MLRVLTTTATTRYFRGIAHCVPFPTRTHTCGGLTLADSGSKVILSGWLLAGRKGQRVSFFPLRDSFGTTQLVIDHEASRLFDVPIESTILIEGTVLSRPDSARRPGPAGQIEVKVDRFTVLNSADRNMPFLPSDTHNLANEELRAKYRYLDLRRPTMTNNLRKRSQVAHIVRDVLYHHDFLEVETPVLLKSSPEGAREFLVPTRTASGRKSDGPMKGDPLFYALPQSPQQPKQLLICSGAVDRYFQLAKCFRDEDGRKDRQPEFTQIDLEMAFVSWGDTAASSPISSNAWRIGGGEVRSVVESLVKAIWKEVEGMILPERFDVMTYHDAMTRVSHLTNFGSDKPDTRFGLEILDLTYFVPSAQRTGSEDLVIECIAVRTDRESDRPFRRVTGKGESDPAVERITLNEKNLSTWLSQSNTLGSDGRATQDQKVNEVLDLKAGDTVWLARRPRDLEGPSTALGRQRLRLSELAQVRGELKLPDAPHFLWITEFPLFTRADKEKDFLAQGRWSSSHHPFTAPMWQDIDALYNGRIDAVRGQHYDLVLNGVEIGGGSVRVHDAAMQEFILSNILQLSEHEISSFNHLLHALKCGAPPHGGIALGFDRLMAILCKTQSIRDVIAFPKTSTGTDPLFKSPAAVTRDVLEQYGI